MDARRRKPYPTIVMNQCLDIPPNIRFEPLLDTPEAYEFSFSAKKEALGPHICARWTWDEDYQRALHAQRLTEKPFFVIFREDSPIGIISWVVYNDYIRFGEFYLFEEHQGHGLGTQILTHALAQADAIGLPVRLEYLKWNPVGSLYLRHGFLPTHESDIHVYLERPISATKTPAPQPPK
jgi:GNAT superfamily N-acetyltransferase